MIPNPDLDLHVLVETAPGPDGAPRVERHRVRAWDEADGSPQVLDRHGGLVAASVLGRVRGVDGNEDR